VYHADTPADLRVPRLVGRALWHGSSSWEPAESAEPSGGCWRAVCAPSVVEHAHSTQIILGEPRGGLTARVTALAELRQQAGIAAEAQENSLVPMWTKFAAICGATVCALTRQPAGPVLASPELRAMVQDTVREVGAVGRARGIPLPEDLADQLMTVFEGYPASARPSLHEDLEAGRRLELESLSGTVLRLGRELGVPTPMNRAIYVALLPYVDGAPMSA
jgi:2-dehydropantoate 2-reductase